MRLADFLQEIGRPVAYYPKLRRITGSTTATILLCQLVYWTGRQADPDGWIYKTAAEIEEETGLSEKEQRTARRNLKGRGLLQERYDRLNHRMYYRVDLAALNAEWEEFCNGRSGTDQRAVRELTNGQFGNRPTGSSNKETEITTEITTETTIIQEEEEGDAAKIAARLMDLGIFPEPAEEIAALMSDAGINPDEAERILLDTMRATGGNLSQAVYRLRRGIWDGGAAALRAADRARYGDGEPQPPEEPSEAEPTEEPEPSEAEQIWQAALAELQLETTRATFNTWLRDTRLVACEDGVFVIGVRNEYAKGWLENRLAPTVCRILRRTTGDDGITVRFVTVEKA